MTKEISSLLLRVKPRLVKPKMFATGDKRCPVNLFKSCLTRRPEGMKTSGPFYLPVVDIQISQTRFKKSRMGKKHYK